MNTLYVYLIISLVYGVYLFVTVLTFDGLEDALLSPLKNFNVNRTWVVVILAIVCIVLSPLLFTKFLAKKIHSYVS